MKTIVDVSKYYFLVEMGMLEWNASQTRTGGRKKAVPASVATTIRMEMEKRGYVQILGTIDYDPETKKVNGILSEFYFQREKTEDGYDPFAQFWRFRFVKSGKDWYGLEIGFSSCEIAIGKDWTKPEKGKKTPPDRNDKNNYDTSPVNSMSLCEEEIWEVAKIIDDTEYYHDHELKYS